MPSATATATATAAASAAKETEQRPGGNRIRMASFILTLRRSGRLGIGKIDTNILRGRRVQYLLESMSNNTNTRASGNA